GDDVVRQRGRCGCAHSARPVHEPGKPEGAGAAVPRGRDVTAPPQWLQPLLDNARSVPAEELSRFLPPEEGGRESAVLVLFGDGPDGPDLLFLERSSER